MFEIYKCIKAKNKKIVTDTTTLIHMLKVIKIKVEKETVFVILKPILSCSFGADQWFSTFIDLRHSSITSVN